MAKVGGGAGANRIRSCDGPHGARERNGEKDRGERAPSPRPPYRWKGKIVPVALLLLYWAGVNAAAAAACMMIVSASLIGPNMIFGGRLLSFILPSVS